MFFVFVGSFTENFQPRANTAKKYSHVLPRDLLNHTSARRNPKMVVLPTHFRVMSKIKNDDER